MAVVIDEFEVVTESPPPIVSQAEADRSAPDDALTVEEIERIMERQMERLARIRAH